jgi:hypothetical protein
MVRRRLIAMAALGLAVVAASLASVAGLTEAGATAGERGPVAVTADLAPAPPPGEAGPATVCLTDPGCAGAWALAGAGLVLLALPVAIRPVRPAAPVVAVAQRPQASHGVRLPARLFRPPRPA